MTEKTAAEILEEIDREKARILADAAARAAELDRKKIDVARVMLEAEALGFKLAPVDKPAGSAPETISDLVAIYKSHPASRYQKLKFASKRHYDAILAMIEADHGSAQLSRLTEDDLKAWYRAWGERNRVSSSHAKIGMVRNICGFGLAVLKDDRCSSLYGYLSKMKFERPAKAVSVHLSAGQATQIRRMAHAQGRQSIALAQAFQFDLKLRQRDVIGEWVPMSEKEVGPTDVFRGDKLKWVRGIRWDAIDDSLILTHSVRPGEKPIEMDLKNAPMVMEELEHVKAVNGGELPKRGPVIVSERFELPWNAVEYRRKWRELADACGVPDTIRNSDSAGGVDPQDSEAEGRTRVAK